MFVGHSARVIEENNVVDISFFQMHTIMISCYGVDLRVPLPKGLFWHNRDLSVPGRVA